MKSLSSVASRPAWRALPWALACIAVGGLAACGQKGPLSLPTGAVAAPSSPGAPPPAPAASASPTR